MRAKLSRFAQLAFLGVAGAALVTFTAVALLPPDTSSASSVPVPATTPSPAVQGFGLAACSPAGHSAYLYTSNGYTVTTSPGTLGLGC